MAEPKPLKVVEAGVTEGQWAAEPVSIVGTLPTGSVPNATTSVKGVVNRASAVADLDGGADLAAVIAKVNDLLAKLRTAGILAP